jgi:hypothetical protein
VSDIGREDDDGESHALPQEITFEKEYALITPEALMSLQAELLCDPCGIPLVDTGKRPPNEDGATHDEMVVHAATRVRRLLAVCRDEKWRRLKTSPCCEAIAKTPLPQIARLALALMRGRGMPSSEAVCAAVTQVECEDYVRVEMALGGSYLDGIEKFRLSRQTHTNYLKQLAGMPKWEWQHDKRGNKRFVPFEDRLKALFPVSGNRGKRAHEMRIERFLHFLVSVARDENPKVVAAEEGREWLKEERLRRLKAGQRVSDEEKIEPLSEEEKRRLLSEEEQEQITADVRNRLKKMQRAGISPILFRMAVIWARHRFDEHVAKARTEASKKGCQALRKISPEVA